MGGVMSTSAAPAERVVGLWSRVIGIRYRQPHYTWLRLFRAHHFPDGTGTLSRR